MLWTFMYHKGSAHYFGTVETKTEPHTEGRALAIATRVCELNGWRAPARVEKHILADESILDAPAPQA